MFCSLIGEDDMALLVFQRYEIIELRYCNNLMREFLTLYCKSALLTFSKIYYLPNFSSGRYSSFPKASLFRERIRSFGLTFFNTLRGILIIDSMFSLFFV